MKPEWLKVAEEEVGVHEILGDKDNSRIVEYHSTTTLKATDDETPWCSSFVNWCFKKVGIKGTGSAAAKSWTEWGVKLTAPKEGCVVVIRQKKKGADAATGSSSGYHVAFFTKIIGDRIYLTGGNQSDSVKVSSFGLANYEVVAYRWPKEEVK